MMTISELIKWLDAAKKSHGDLNVGVLSSSATGRFECNFNLRPLVLCMENDDKTEQDVFITITTDESYETIVLM